MELEMKIIGRETIKPSKARPSHQKTYKLSLLDQIFPAFHIPLLVFYKKAPAMSTLKSSLSDTLSLFYPLAGRCTDDSSVSCDDHGIPFFQTHLNSCLADLLTSTHKLQLLPQLFPPQEFLALGPRPISHLVPLAFQLNVFACGGLVIGTYMLHKLLDASSLGTFFRCWADLASNNASYRTITKPDFDSIVKAFPPCPSIDRNVVPDLSNNPNSDSRPIVVLVKSFRLTTAHITNLKALAATDSHPSPTTFETIAGFVWEHVAAAAAAAAARGGSSSNNNTTILSVTINMRSRTNPSIPKEAMGNCITDVHAKATTHETFQELVRLVHCAVSTANDKIKTFQGENGVEEIRADRLAASEFVMQDNASVYQLSSWCKLGLSQADFGFGKPNWVVPTQGHVPPSLRNFIFFTDYCGLDGEEGVEVWLFLEENEMQMLGSTTTFLHFASPY